MASNKDRGSGISKLTIIKIVLSLVACGFLIVAVFLLSDYMAIGSSLYAEVSNMDSREQNQTKDSLRNFVAIIKETKPSGSVGDVIDDGSIYVEPDGDTTGEDTVNGSVLDFTAGGNFACPHSNFCYTYMAWQFITSESSPQHNWRKTLFPDWVNEKYGPGSAKAFDSEGFGKVNGRYVVATTDMKDGGIGAVGMKLDVYLDTGKVLKCIVGDIKSSGDSNWTRWGHLHSGSLSTIEFIVDYHKFYNPNKSNPGTPNCHPEWKGKIVKIVREV